MLNVRFDFFFTGIRSTFLHPKRGHDGPPANFKYLYEFVETTGIP